MKNKVLFFFICFAGSVVCAQTTVRTKPVYGYTPPKTTIPVTTNALIRTLPADVINAILVGGGGVIDSSRNIVIKERGICWGFSQQPTIRDKKVVAGSGTGTFRCQITDFTPGKVYYMRAYAVTARDVQYGQPIGFMTSDPSLRWYKDSISATSVAGSLMDGLKNTKALLKWPKVGYGIDIDQQGLPPHLNSEQWKDIKTPIGSVEYCMRMNYDANGILIKGITPENMWYLPASKQLMMLWIDKDCSPFPFAEAMYWSSTEYVGMIGESMPWSTYFSDGYSTSHYVKAEICRVRCIRNKNN